ncbi:hypothetical protein L1D61_25675 [Vibrio mediterranei]|uniref:VspD n=1 Tax=Vibrio mediterranei TaxID=689 RepID=A0A3G4VJQ9_9VIBR|nr:hypothetical protein [Vibrio mediterranei]AYV25046.1 hypothetical protein ECB94_27470 [Vibrio mediterranei]MCG9790534.1 hypothetical protein [Vibrio mediterranei]
MSTFMNTISAPSYVSAVEEQSKSEQEILAQRSVVESASPKQPLPGSSVSLSALWRLVEEQMKEVANAVSGTGKENSKAKKSMIEVQKESQISQLKERERKIEEQAKGGFWSILGMALGFIAAIVIAPFNPVMSAIMIGTMVAAIVIPKLADQIMKAAGVAEKIREKVKMGLEIGIGLAGMLLSFNPVQLVKNVANTTATVAAKVANRVIDAMTSLRSLLANLNPAKLIAMLGKSAANSASKATKLLDTAVNALKAFKTTLVSGSKLVVQKAADTVTKVMSQALETLNQLKASFVKVLDAAKSAGIALKEQLASLIKAVDKASSVLGDFAASVKNLNPANMLNKLSEITDKISDMLKTVKAMRPSQLLDKAKQMLSDAVESLKDLITNSEKASLRASRVNQVMEVGSNAASVVSIGYSVKSANISKDLEIAQAKQEELETRIQQILTMISQAMRSVTQAFESLYKTQSDHREFNGKMISINM